MDAPPLPGNESQRLRALREYKILDTPLEAGFDALTRLAAYILDVPVALVSLVDAERQWFKSRLGIEAKEYSRDISFCGHVVAMGREMVVEDAQADQRFADNPLVTGPPHIRFYAGQPLRSPEGYILGTLCAIDSRPRKLEPEQLELLQLLAEQVVARLELHRQIRRLADKEARLRAILEAVRDPIVTIDGHGTLIAVNTATLETFGFHQEDLLGRKLTQLVPDLTGDVLQEALQHLLHDAKHWSRPLELIGRRSDDVEVPVELSLAPMTLPDGQLFAGVLRDISSHKKAEATIAAILTVLRKSQQDLLLILDQLQIGTFVLDADGRFAFVSRACREMLGIDMQRAVGRAWEEVLTIEHRSRDELREMLHRSAPQRSRLDIRLPADKEEPPRRVALDIRDDPRDSSRRLVFLYDISDLQELREQVARLRAGEMIGDSPAMLDLYGVIARVAAGDWTVLIEGETGVGKELVARAIHSASLCRDGPFIAVNCAGLADSLLTSQLFGHVRGAFTGALSDRQGLF
jgi:PAS domain S-box-containing protein